jgi:hypothetical protein
VRNLVKYAVKMLVDGIVVRLHGEFVQVIVNMYLFVFVLVKLVKNFFFDQSMENILNTDVYEIRNVLLHVQHELNVNFVVIRNVFQLE